MTNFEKFLPEDENESVEETGGPEPEKMSNQQVYDVITSRKPDWQQIIYDLISSEQLDPWDIDLVLLTRKYFEKIAKERNLKAATVWMHLANLIEFNQLSVWKVIPPEKVNRILPSIISEEDELKGIKQKIQDDSINYDEINCVLAYVRSKNKAKNIIYRS